jgi:hypothetical protein
MPPKTVATPEEVKADLHERGIIVDNSLRSTKLKMGRNPFGSGAIAREVQAKIDKPDFER